MDMNDVQKDIGDLYADTSACLLAIAAALEKKGLLSNDEIREAAQERLLTIDIPQLPQRPYLLLRAMATDLPSRPDE